MERAEAYKTLRLDPTADGQMVEHAYWSLARQAQERVKVDVGAREEIERLSEAYNVLVPHGRPMRLAALAAEAPAESGVPALDGFVDWVSQQAWNTRKRWARRNPEIAVIGGASFFMMLLAIGSGASLMAILLCALLICGAIWAPWRRVN